jgi:hypothetical protein
MGPIATDSNNPSTKSRYASYFALDKSLRPIYARHGFALSFGTGEIPQENYIRVLCYVSHSAGFTRTYHVDMPADGKGAKGGDVMTKTHAVGSGMTYGQRYLLKMIFNIAIGSDDDGNAAGARVPSPSDAPPAAASPPKHQKPREITPEPNDTFPLWEGRYMAALQGAASVAELIEWDNLNDAPLATISNKAPQIYSRIMNQFEALKAKFKPDPISSGVPKAPTTGFLGDKPMARVEPAKAILPAGCPDAERDPDGFVEWASKRLRDVYSRNNPDELTLIWQNEITPASDGLFKPDCDLLQSLYDELLTKLGG